MPDQIVVIAPYGSVTDVRDAGGDLLGDGRDLQGGGVAWDLSLSDDQRQEIEAAGAEIHERSRGEYLSDVVESAGYAIDPPETI